MQPWRAEETQKRGDKLLTSNTVITVFFQPLTHFFKTLHTNPKIAHTKRKMKHCIQKITHLKSKHLQTPLP